MRKQQANPAMARDDLLPEDYALDQTISEAATWLTSRQQGDGHWVFELEAMRRSRPSTFCSTTTWATSEMISNGRSPSTFGASGRHGGWPLYHDGDFDLSASVKAYYALKLA